MAWLGWWVLRIEPLPRLGRQLPRCDSGHEWCLVSSARAAQLGGETVLVGEACRGVEDGVASYSGGRTMAIEAEDGRGDAPDAVCGGGGHAEG